MISGSITNDSYPAKKYILILIMRDNKIHNSFWISLKQSYFIIGFSKLSWLKVYPIVPSLHFPQLVFHFESNILHFRFRFLESQQREGSCERTWSDSQSEREVSTTMGIKLYYTTVTASRDVSRTVLDWKSLSLFWWFTVSVIKAVDHHAKRHRHTQHPVSNSFLLTNSNAHLQPFLFTFWRQHG